jgi:hypothetical protein
VLVLTECVVVDVRWHIFGRVCQKIVPLVNLCKARMWLINELLILAGICDRLDILIGI